MKSIPLQLVTIELENGHYGIFVGLPLIPNHTESDSHQVSEVWFSNVRGIPDNMSVDQLIELVQAQLCRCKGELH